MTFFLLSNEIYISFSPLTIGKSFVYASNERERERNWEKGKKETATVGDRKTSYSGTFFTSSDCIKSTKIPIYQYYEEQ